MAANARDDIQSALASLQAAQGKPALYRQRLEALLAEHPDAGQHSTALGAGLGGLGAALEKTGNAFMASSLQKRIAQSDRDVQSSRAAALRAALLGDTSNTSAGERSLEGASAIPRPPGDSQGNNPGDPSGPGSPSLGPLPPARSAIEGPSPYLGGSKPNLAELVDVEPSQDEQARALANALRKRRANAEMLAASGDPQLAALGTNLLADVRTEDTRGYERRAKLADMQSEQGFRRSEAETNRSWETGEHVLNRQSQERAAALAAGRAADREDRSEQKAIDREDRAAQRKQESAARDVEERYANIDRTLSQLEEVVKNNGTWDLTGPTNANLEGLITSYATDMAKLRDPTSVAREGEVALEKRGLFEPGLGTRNSTALTMIQNARDRVKERRNEAYTVRGLQPPGDGGGGNRKIAVNRATGERRYLNADGSLGEAVK